MERYLTIKETIETKIAVNIEVPEPEVRKFYDENQEKFKQPETIKASHILVKVAPDADDAQKAKAREKIEEIRKKISDGGDFAALASEFSEGPSKNKGGDLGFFGRGKMVKAFEKVAFAMKTNEVSDPVTTRFGYHLIKVTGKKTEQIRSYGEVKDRIADYLKQNKKNEKVIQHLEKLKKSAKIEKFI